MHRRTLDDAVRRAGSRLKSNILGQASIVPAGPAESRDGRSRGQAKIDQFVIETGDTPDKLVEDTMAGYVAVELTDYH